MAVGDRGPMAKTIQKFLLVAAAAVLCLAPAAFADTASMTLTGAGSNVLDGVYIGPYTATIDGVSTPVICDDFAAESYIPESWTANVSTFSSLSNVKFTSGTVTQNYEEAAYLALELLAAPKNSLQAGEIQFALWGLFDPSALTVLSAYNAAYGAAAQAYLTDAQNNYSTLTAAQLAQITIYTPNTNYAITCGSGPCRTTPPQEFIVVRTPEPTTLLLLGLGLGSLFFLKRREHLSSSS